VLPVLLLTPTLSRRRAQVQRIGPAGTAPGRHAAGNPRARSAAAALHRGGEPQQLPRRRGAGGDAAALLQLRDQARNVGGTLAGTLLRRIGAEFVERGDRIRGARDARRLLRNAAIGHSLVFFPEGTFSSDVGLLRFHIGAFAAAVRADLPVVPVAIRGTRHCLPPGSPWPRPGTIRIEALAALPSQPAAPGTDPAIVP
jgi:hypothetical protein